MSSNKLGSFVTRLFGIRFKKGANNWNPSVRSSTTDVHWLLETVSAILLLGAINRYTPQPDSKLEKLGSFIRKIQPPHPQRMTGEIDPPPAGTTTEFVIILSNLGCDDLDLTESIAAIKELNFFDENNEALTAEPYLASRTFTSNELVTLLEFRQKLGDCDLLNQRTLVTLNNKMQDSAMKTLLASCDATDFGDFTGPSQTDPADPQTKAWTQGLVKRLTTGGPNGSMAGQIASDFVDTVTLPSFYAEHKKIDVFAALDMSVPVVAILQDAVDSAAQSTAKGLTAYLSKLSESRDDTDVDRQTATMVKGIKDSMSSTGKTVAQLAVFNALGNDLITELPKEEQLQVAYTVANATRAAVEATGNHIADLYQANEIPTNEELKAIGALGLGDFLSSVATTVANGVMQAAPVILNSVANSIAANNSLSSKLPPSVMLTFLDSVKELPPAAKITLASRIVNGVNNPDANVVTDKAVMDLAARTSQLGAQATLDTFNNTPAPEMDKNDPEHRKKFRQVALAVSTLSPTLSNVTDIGATNLVTDATLARADSLRQNALEVGIRASANMIADNPTETMLFKVHQYRLKTGRDLKPRIFGLLMSVVPIAAKIASTVIPALMNAF